MAAAVEVIAEVGLERATHRAIATRAGVPLGSTTYYFPTLEDLLDLALEQVMTAARTQIAGWADALAQGHRVDRVLPGLIIDYLADSTQALLDYEIYLAAARTERLRPLAVAWIDDLTAVLEPVVGPRGAQALVTLIDGAMLGALVTGVPPDREAVQWQVARLIR